MRFRDITRSEQRLPDPTNRPKEKTRLGEDEHRSSAGVVDSKWTLGDLEGEGEGEAEADTTWLPGPGKRVPTAPFLFVFSWAPGPARATPAAGRSTVTLRTIATAFPHIF